MLTVGQYRFAFKTLEKLHSHQEFLLLLHPMKAIFYQTGKPEAFLNFTYCNKYEFKIVKMLWLL